MNSSIYVARSIRRALALGSVTALSGLIAAQAQEQAPAASEQQLQTVVVTGSIIRRSDFETPSPVQVVTATDLQQSGYTSVSDVLRNLAANGQGTLTQSFGLAFAGGGSGVALRGLTVGGTLTLIDGMRMIPYPLADDGQRNFVDVSSIPFNVIDSVQVLKDGASAEYGSDAIAGVVNIILKKTFTGLSVTAEAGTSQRSDGTTEHLAGIGGIGDLASDGYNAYLAVEWRHQDAILLRNRSGLWTNLNWLPYGGFDTHFGSQNGAAGLNSAPAVQGGYTIPGGAISAASTFLNPHGGCINYTVYANGGCSYLPGWQIQPQTSNANFLGRFTKNLSGDWQAVVTGSLFRSKSEQVGANGAAYPTINGFNPTTLTAIEPGLPPTAVTTPAIIAGPNSPAATVGQPLFLNLPQLGMQQTQFVTNTYRLFADLRGTAAGWDIDATGGYMYAMLTQDGTGYINPGLAATSAANGQNWATLNTGQLENAIAPPWETKDTNNMEVVDVHGTHDLFQLPGGALTAAIGGGMYHLFKNSPAALSVAAGEQFGNNAFAIGGQTNYNGYLEFVAPIFHGLELDLAGRYDHYNQYGSSTTPKFGLKWTPIKYVTLRGTYGKGFRAPNAAESGLSGASFGGYPFNDSLLCPNPATPQSVGNFPSQCNLGGVGLQVASKTLQPEKSTNWTAGLIFAPVDNTSISFDYWDIKINQDIQSGVNAFFLGADPSLFPIIRQPAKVLPLCTAINPVTGNCVLTPTSTAAFAGGLGPVLYQQFPYLNLTQTHINGLDVDLLSKFGIGTAGTLSAQLNYTHMFHYMFGLAGQQFDLAGTHGPQIISGDTGNPKDRAVASLAWDYGPLNVTASVNYIGHFSLTDPTSGITTCNIAIRSGGLGGRFPAGTTVPAGLAQYCDVASFTDVDLFARYAISKNWDIHGSVLNVLGQQPPVDLQTYGASGNDPYNPAMHQAGAVGRFFMLGATYTY